MGGDSWSLTAKPCDSCKAVAATVFCRADSAFLCATCDGELHAATKPDASRHARVLVCVVCEQAPAAVTCKADAAALCPTCDADIHSANPLARRHERFLVVPFYDSGPFVKTPRTADAEEYSEEEAEAASWLLPDPNSKAVEESGSPEYNKSTEYLFSDMDPDPYPDLDLIPCEQKAGHNFVDEKKQYSADGVVPVRTEKGYGSGRYPGPVVNGYPTYDVEYAGSKPFMYNFTSQSISHSVSPS